MRLDLNFIRNQLSFMEQCMAVHIVTNGREYLKLIKKNIQFCKDEDAFYYIWGWPGPDVNIYKFEDYGKTWAFRKRDFQKIGGSES